MLTKKVTTARMADYTSVVGAVMIGLPVAVMGLTAWVLHRSVVATDTFVAVLVVGLALVGLSLAAAWSPRFLYVALGLSGVVFVVALPAVVRKLTVFLPDGLLSEPLTDTSTSLAFFVGVFAFLHLVHGGRWIWHRRAAATSADDESTAREAS